MVILYAVTGCLIISLLGLIYECWNLHTAVNSQADALMWLITHLPPEQQQEFYQDFIVEGKKGQWKN